MAKFHVNPATGEPGECKAEIKCRFGSPEEHYTSEAAARKAFEANQPLFPPKQVEETPAEILDRAQTLVPARALRRETYDQLPTGTIILQVHNESGDQNYLSKEADGKTRSISYSTLTVGDDVLFNRGSRTFYEAESPFENEFTASQLSAAWENNEVTVSRIARELHESWREELLPDSHELAGLSYDELPPEWRRENRDSAESAFTRICQGVANHWSRRELGAMIHRDWMDRNKDRAPAEQLLPFNQLSEGERRKDYVVLEAAAEVIASYPRRNFNG